MPTRPPTHRPSGARTRQLDTARPSSRQRGYTTRWDKARLAYLKAHPLCMRCLQAGDYTAAEVVDHVVPHRGDQGLFWDVSNWQSLCTLCHNRKTSKEDGGFGRG